MRRSIIAIMICGSLLGSRIYAQPSAQPSAQPPSTAAQPPALTAPPTPPIIDTYSEQSTYAVKLCTDYINRIPGLEMEIAESPSKKKNIGAIFTAAISAVGVKNHRQSRWLPSLRGTAQSGLIMAPLTSGPQSHLKVAPYPTNSSWSNLLSSFS